MNTFITQAEARRQRKRLREFEERDAKQRNAWAKDWPGGVNIGNVQIVEQRVIGAIVAARKLGHAVVVTAEANGDIAFFALGLR